MQPSVPSAAAGQGAQSGNGGLNAQGDHGAPSATAAYATAEQVARESYGRLLAWLAYQWRDVAAAEDALSTALSKALTLWPTQGVPDSPQAWLLSVAKRELLQVARHQRLHDSPEVQALLLGNGNGDGDEDGSGLTRATATVPDMPTLPDNRLKLLFVCAHPAIDASVRPALMLQTVMGLDAQVVAQAMLTSPTAMAQRLVRAKQKIRVARLRFEEPETDELPERLHAVFEAIYAAYGLGWDAVDGGDEAVQGLRAEALFLGELVAQLLPDQAEAKGLLALMLFCEARTEARTEARSDARTALGDASNTSDEADKSNAVQFIPLAEQDTQRWNRTLITTANALLWQAAAQNTPQNEAQNAAPSKVGPFQIEAAIQSAHCERLFGHPTPWAAIAQLYGRLLDLAPTLGAQVAHALAWAQCGETDKAHALLAALAHPGLKDYQAYWVALAHVARLRGDTGNADTHLNRAIGLTTSPAVRRYLLGQLRG